MSSSILIFFILYLCGIPCFSFLTRIANGLFIYQLSLQLWLILLYFMWKRGFSDSSIWKKLPEKLSVKSGLINFSYGIVIFFVTFSIGFIYLYISAYSGRLIPEAVQTHASLQTVFHQLISTCIITPISEELFFRSGVYNSYRTKYTTGVAIILSSLLFAFSHMRADKILNTFFMGICLALVYEKYKNIWAPILLHMANNLCASIVLLFGMPLIFFVIFDIISIGVLFTSSNDTFYPHIKNSLKKTFIHSFHNYVQQSIGPILHS